MTRVLLVVAVLGLLVPPGSAMAANGDVPTLTGYSVTSWTAGEDLILGPIRALAQDRDDYLWLGTDRGLLRFDGFHFSADVVRGATLPALPVRALHVARDGALWIGLGDGGGIFRLAKGRLSSEGGGARITGAVTSFAEDTAGTLWAGHDSGLLRLTATGGWMTVGPQDGFPSLSVHHLRAAGDALFVGTAAGLYRRDATGGFSRIARAGDNLIRGTVEDERGAIWLTDTLRGFRPLDGDDGQPHALAGRGGELLRDSRGNIWMGTIGQGLWRIDTKANAVRDRLTLQNGLLTDGIWSLLEDREGNIWVGTHEGLNRLTRHTLTPLGDLGITSSIVAGRDGVIWAASSQGVVAFSGVGPEPDRRVFPLPGARTLYVDHRGTVWAAAAAGLVRFSQGRFISLPAPGVRLNRITAIGGDTRNTLWIADAGQGLWTWDGSRLTPWPLPESFSSSQITALHGDNRGTMWLAFDRGRLGAIGADGTFTPYGVAEGLAHDRINGIYETSVGLLVAGTNGLSRLADGRFVTIGREQGLPSRRVAGVAESHDGALWVAMGDIGLARLPAEDVAKAASQRAYRARVQLFDTSDGMAGMPLTIDSKTVARGTDGRLWFVTGRGLTVVDPLTAIARQRANGPARVEAVFADDRRFEVADGTPLPAGTDRLRIDYTAIDLSAPEHRRFRYRLEGFDDAWREAGSRRQAFYTNLPPRDYRFVVQAEGSDGAWSTSAVGLTLSIAPRFHQTWTFYGLCGVIALLLIGTVWQLRLRQVRHEFDIVLAERMRLSREIHDTLLQSMVGVALHIDNVARAADAPRAQLVTLRRAIEDCIVEARQSIWDLRSVSGGQADLIAALERAGARSTADTSVSFRLSVTGAPRRCGDGVETDLLRIAQEALHNAVRHGSPTQVSLDLHYDRDAVILRVTDDGIGFEQAARAGTNHFGLATMRERAEHLGGQFRLTSRAGGGTRIETVIPVST